MKKEKIKDIVAGVFSIIFIISVFYFYTGIFHSVTLGYSQHQEFKFITYNQTEHKFCYINIQKPTIILRLDGVRAYSRLTKPLVDEILRRNLSVVLGVIPYNLEKDEQMVDYLLKIRENPHVEIAQHGLYHNISDINITKEELLEENIKIQKILGVLPVTYIPPYDNISKNAKEEVSSLFKVISGEEGVLKEGKIVEIGYTVAIYDFNKNFDVPIEEIIEKCKNSLEKTNLCVILIHPQDYSINISNALYLSDEKFAKFKNMLDQLEGLGAEFSTFKDIIACTDLKQ